MLKEILEAQHLSYRFSAQSPWIIKDFNFTLKSGEIVGLMGTSGQGKTTIGKLLSGYLDPTQGQVTLSSLPLPKKCFSPVQMITQSPELAMNPKWKIKKIISEGGLGNQSHHDLSEWQIDSSWLERYPHQLSGGELQRVALARVAQDNATFNNALRFLICDEITAMLDAPTQAKLWQTILQKAETHQWGILIISHDEALLKKLTHKIVVLSNLSSHCI